MANRKSTARSRKVWATILTILSALVPTFDGMTDIDLAALVPALDNFVQIGFSLVAAGLVTGSILRPDKHGKEPELIAKRR